MNAQREQLFLEASPVEFLFTVNPTVTSDLTQDFVELMRSLQYLKEQAWVFKGDNSRKVAFRNVKGQRKNATVYAFIMKGLPHLCKGVDSIMKEKDFGQMVAEIRRFEAVVRLAIDTRVHYEDISSDMIQSAMDDIELQKSLGLISYDEREWILEVKNYGMAYVA